MKIFQLKGYKRDFVGRKAAKAYRRKSHIPCVLYGGKEEIFHFSIAKESICKLIYTPEVYIVELNIEEKLYCAILKEKQLHPVSDELLHIDFLRIYEDKLSVIEIPVALEGLAEGARSGGKLILEMRKLKVRGFYKDFPEQLVVNVERLGLGKTLQVGDLFFNKLELLNAKNSVVASVKLTRVARSTTAATTT